jgi:hypothetical protein
MPLVAHYPLQEDSGSTAYDFVGQNNGTNNGATVGANGILGTSAYSFDSSSEYIDTGIRSISPPFSLGCWVKIDGTNSDSHFISNWNSTGDDLFLILDHDGGSNPPNWSIKHDADGTQIFAGDPSADTWYQVVVTHNESELELWVDGVKIGSKSDSTTATINNDYNFRIGNDHQNHNTNGDIADVRIYDHALTPAEVQYLNETSRNGSGSWQSEKKII